MKGKNKNNPTLLYLHDGPGSLLFSYARDIRIENNPKNDIISYNFTLDQAKHEKARKPATGVVIQ